MLGDLKIFIIEEMDDQKSQRLGETGVKQCFLNMTGPLPSWTRSSYSHLHKTKSGDTPARGWGLWGATEVSGGGKVSFRSVAFTGQLGQWMALPPWILGQHKLDVLFFWRRCEVEGGWEELSGGPSKIKAHGMKPSQNKCTVFKILQLF